MKDSDYPLVGLGITILSAIIMAWIIATFVGWLMA